MTYQLIYWPLPFRGNFIRLLLEIAGQPYTETDMDGVMAWKNQPPENQSLPTMAPPFLIDDSSAGYGQLPVIMQHLSERHGLMPETDYNQKLCLKLMLDASDILLEITCHHGMVMWQDNDWNRFRTDRLPRWMQIFEQTYQKFGQPGATGFFGDTLTQADIIVYGLWGTMITRLPPLRTDLEHQAPALSRLVNSLAQHPKIADFEKRQFDEHGDLYCGGDIERSLRAMLTQ